MLTEKQKAASKLIARAGAAGTMQARARNLAKVIEALGLPGQDMIGKAVELRREARGADPFEMLAAQCHERLGMHFDAGHTYFKHDLRREVERIIEQCSKSIFNMDKYHAAMLAMLLPDFGHAARLAAEIEHAGVDFLTLERARESEGAYTQNNLILAGKIYAQLHRHANVNDEWADGALRIAAALQEDGCFGEAALLHYMLGNKTAASSVAAMIFYDPDRPYDDEIFQMLIRIGMKSKAEEFAEEICRKPSRMNRITRAAEIFAITGNATKAAKIYLDCERHLDALVVLGMEK